MSNYIYCIYVNTCMEGLKHSTLKVQEKNHLYIPIENPAPLFKRLHVCTYLVVSGKVISGEYSINTISMENSNQFIYT